MTPENQKDINLLYAGIVLILAVMLVTSQAELSIEERNRKDQKEEIKSLRQEILSKVMVSCLVGNKH